MSDSLLRRVVVETFGGVEQLKIREERLPIPGAGHVRVRITSIGMNHADLMARAGQYRLSSGDPPFTPGLEAGGIIEALGPGVTGRRLGERVVIGPDAPRRENAGCGGTYRSHYLVPAEQTFLAPAQVPDEQLGGFWLTYLTAWGCLAWRQPVQPGQFIGLPAASSGVALAAAQIVKERGATPIGLTSSPDKVARLKALSGCAYAEVVATRDAQGQTTPWYKDIKRLTQDHGIDVWFDPVAAGDFLNSEIRTLAQEGTIWVYGLLGDPGVVDVTPLIRKHASIRGWSLGELTEAGPKAFEPGCRHILEQFAAGHYHQHVERTFKLDEVQQAHAYMHQGRHVGKLFLVP